MVLGLSLDPKDIIESMSPYAELGLMGIVFAETGLLVGFFLPGDSLLFTAGLLAADGSLNIWLLLVGCFAAAVVGDQVGFTFGERVGPSLFRRPNSRFFKQEYIERTRHFFERHGPKTVVLARFVPVVRTFAPVLAGVGDMPRRTFFRYNVVGAFFWAVGVTLAGYFLSSIVGDSIDKYLLPIVAVIVLLSLVPPLLEWNRQRRHPVEPASPEVAAAEAEELEHLLHDPDE